MGLISRVSSRTYRSIMPSKGKRFNVHFPAPRVKQIMQADEEVGKVAQTAPVVVAKSVELFLLEVLKNSLDIAQNEYSTSTITPLQIKMYVERTPHLEFLKEIVDSISTDEKKYSRKRKNNSIEDDETKNENSKTVKIKKSK